MDNFGSGDAAGQHNVLVRMILDTSNRTAGVEMLLLECLFFMSDTMGLQREALADRLENTARILKRDLSAQDGDMEETLIPMKRVAEALRAVRPLDSDGNLT